MGRGRRAALGFWLDLAFGFALRRDGESSRVASAFFACAKQSTQKKAHPWLCAAATQQYPAMLARKGATETRPRGETKAQISRRSDQNKRSEEHTSELQSLMRISYAVFCLKKKKTQQTTKEKANTQQTK